MLELIVLGRVPGTHLQITLNWVMVFLAIALMGVEFYRVLQKNKTV